MRAALLVHALSVTGSLLLGTASCARDSHLTAVTVDDPRAEIVSLRTALEEARANPLSERVVTDLVMAEGWLDTAEQMLGQGRRARRDAELLLTVARGQLVKVRSYYGRLEAEAALTQAGVESDKLRDDADALTESNAATARRMLEE